MTREICKICWQVNRVGFKVPDWLWRKVIHPFHWEHVVCLRCFTQLADEHMEEWDREIEFFPVSAVTHLGVNKTILNQIQEIKASTKQVCDGTIQASSFELPKQVQAAISKNLGDRRKQMYKILKDRSVELQNGCEE